MSARKSSEVVWKRGKERMRSIRSKGIPWIWEVARGDCFAGLDGLNLESKLRTKETSADGGEAVRPWYGDNARPWCRRMFVDGMRGYDVGARVHTK